MGRHSQNFHLAALGPTARSRRETGLVLLDGDTMARLSTDPKKSPSWRLPEQVRATLPPDHGGDPLPAPAISRVGPNPEPPLTPTAADCRTQEPRAARTPSSRILQRLGWAPVRRAPCPVSGLGILRR